MSIRKAEDNFDAKTATIVYSASHLSSCRRRKVGAGVFDLTGKLIATGYNRERPFDNGTTRSCLEGDCPRGMAPYDVIPADSPYSDCISDHAEIVAFSNAYGNEDRAAWFSEPDIVMVVTHKPCHECTEVIDALGIDVVYLEEL